MTLTKEMLDKAMYYINRDEDLPSRLAHVPEEAARALQESWDELAADENGLLPCPFCGGRAAKFHRDPHDICMCENEDCFLAGFVFPLHSWQERPILKRLIGEV